MTENTQQSQSTPTASSNATEVLNLNHQAETQQPQEDHTTTSTTATTDSDAASDVQIDVKQDDTFSKSPPILLEWENIEFKVKVRKKKSFRKENKQILHPQSGYALPGSIVAIMGPSGCGKTSLYVCHTVFVTILF
jgi:ABC-type glutathione transport system ATPase component